MRSFSFMIVKKTSLKKKSRHVIDGSSQCLFIKRKDTASPTANTDSLFATSLTDAQEGRDVGSLDVPNAFIQTRVA